MYRIILMAMVLAVTVAGCNRFPDNGLQISANLLPDGSCVVAGDQEERLLRGLWDTSPSLRNADGNAPDYLVALQLQSYLVSNALEFQGDQSNIQVDNYDITLLLPDGSKPDLGDLVNPYRVTTSAVIESTEPGGDPVSGGGFCDGHSRKLPRRLGGCLGGSRPQRGLAQHSRRWHDLRRLQPAVGSVSLARHALRGLLEQLRGRRRQLVPRQAKTFGPTARSSAA